jgi:hypothetical protein
MKSPPDEQVMAGIIARQTIRVGCDLIEAGIEDGKRLSTTIFRQAIRMDNLSGY